MTGDSHATGTSGTTGSTSGSTSGAGSTVASTPAPATPPDPTLTSASRRRPGGRAVGLVLWVLGGVVLAGLWSRTALTDPDTSEWSTFAMPAATVDVDGSPVRVTAVHPVPPLPEITGVWHQEMADLARRAHDEPLPQVLLGDFNATYDHASFRAVLGDRFHDATRTAGRGLNLSWPVGERVPTFLDLDHVVVDAGMRVDDLDSLVVPGSDHRALAVTVQVAP
ncbi:endonuclease/exonuclease/phosphatase family protein [Oerskovia sp. NPDC057915]|uniref:endonuclease/exonuclease/phosphatase family protein n=1 Tax=Oerskovia sp. NPDC057915 TaxID=3346280 RepID=UPI0036D7C77F